MAGISTHQLSNGLRNGSHWVYPPALVSAWQQLAEARKGLEGEGGSIGMVEQHHTYWHYASLPHVQTICEIGFNKGHSALVWLMANPRARVVMFDLFAHAAAPAAERFLREKMPGVNERLVLYKGPSQSRLADAYSAGERCDVMSIDGGHTYENALADLEGMHALASTRLSHVAFIDDTNCQAAWCVPVDKAVAKYGQRHNLTILERYGWSLHKRGYAKGLTVFRYGPFRREAHRGAFALAVERSRSKTSLAEERG